MSSPDTTQRTAPDNSGLKHTQHLRHPSTEHSDDSNPKSNESGNEREVTDPITHLPLIIHDANHLELEQIPWLASVPDSSLPSSESSAPLNRSSIDSESKSAETQSSSQTTHEAFESTAGSSTRNTWIPDPEGDAKRTRLQTSIVAAAASTVGLLIGSVGWESVSWVLGGRGKWFGWLIMPLACLIFGLGVGVTAMTFGAGWKEPPHQPNERNLMDVHAQNDHEGSSLESPQWLNNLLQSLWPIIDPSLFASLSDMLEDTMQATLPSLINGVRVADLGQGSEPVRILSIKMLDKGRATKDVDGMKAEEGDFVNLEIGIGYRTVKSTKSGMKDRSKNLHLLIEFYTAGGLTIPVFVNLTSLLALMRVRIQLTPNPPFLSVLTLSLMGQPHVSLNCTPLSKNLFNVMDIPGLSGWLKSSIDLAVSAYVAPRSISLDLKELLAGREPMDVQAMGVVFLRIKRARDIGDGDGVSAKGIVDGKKGKRGDAYITVAWKKWGKALWSTRIISGSKQPLWEETCVLIVGKEELDAGESVRVQVWDADKYTADDILGNIDVPLKSLMDSPNPSELFTRSDGLKDDKGRDHPGTLDWEIGYFKKTTLEQQFEAQGKTAQDAKRWRDDVEKEAEGKLREAMPEEDTQVSGLAKTVVGGLSSLLGGESTGDDHAGQGEKKSQETMNAATTFRHDASAKDHDQDAESKNSHEGEIAQQKLEDFKEKTDELISSSSPPTHDWPSGILSILIESISGLEVEKIKETGVNPQNNPEQQQSDIGVEGNGGGEGGDLPSSYCVVVLNHEKVYKTRVKMKSNNPFFNAQTEKFISDLTTASLFISVRDNRMHENNPIIGVVSLPLNRIFSSKKSSMFCDSLPLVGGIGFGKMRVKLLWRSVQLKLPKELRGWNIGTLEVGKEGVKVTQWFIQEAKKDWEACRLIFWTDHAKGKMLPTSSRRAHTGTDDEGQDIKSRSDWAQKRGQALHLPITMRYKTCVTLEVRKRAVGPDRSMAFGTFWLKDMADDEEGAVVVDLWRASANSNSTPSSPKGEENHAVSGGLLSSLNPMSNSRYGRTSNLMEYARANVCTVSDMEQQSAEKVCTVEVPVKFWSGMSGYHKKMADKETSGNLKDVMEVLDYVQGEEEGKIGGADDWGDNDSSSSSSDSEPDQEVRDGNAAPGASNHVKEDSNSSKGPIQTLTHTKDSIVDEAKSFRKHQHGLQRKHRGLMQWKAARHVAWLGREMEEKAEKVAEKVKYKVHGKVKNPQKGAGIEKEV